MEKKHLVNPDKEYTGFRCLIFETSVSLKYTVQIKCFKGLKRFHFAI